MSAAQMLGVRRLQGVDLLRARFGERLRELLPAGDLTVSQPVRARTAAATESGSAGLFTWTQGDTTIECRNLD